MPGATFAILFCVLWLSGQVIIPLLQKFDLTEHRYRYARHSWAMFGRNPLIYRVSIFVRTEAGREAIPDLHKHVHGLRSPGPALKVEGYRSVEQVQAWHARLIEHIAAQRHDGREYVVEIVWTRHFEKDRPKEWAIACRRAACTSERSL
jgi:hypothetical protein